MKLTSIAILLLLICGFQKTPQDIILEGKYKMEYETEYANQNCIINIKGSKYVKTFENKSKKKGTIELKKYKFGQEYILREKDSDLEVIVDGTTYKPSDTVYFRTKNINQKESENGIIISSGKLIKLK